MSEYKVTLVVLFATHMWEYRYENVFAASGEDARMQAQVKLDRSYREAGVEVKHMFCVSHQ